MVKKRARKPVRKKKPGRKKARSAGGHPHEVCFLLDDAGRVLWSDEGETAYALPDSRARWHAIWSLRAELAEIAHSHPGGPLGFSGTDETTMEALIRGLGKEIRFSVVAPGGMIVREAGQDRLIPEGAEPAWAAQLRRKSGIE